MQKEIWESPESKRLYIFIIEVLNSQFKYEVTAPKNFKIQPFKGFNPNTINSNRLTKNYKFFGTVEFNVYVRNQAGSLFTEPGFFEGFINRQ